MVGGEKNYDEGIEQRLKKVSTYLEKASTKPYETIEVPENNSEETSRLINNVMNYNPAIEEKGPTNTDMGHELADSLFKKYGSIENIPRKLRTGGSEE